MTPLRPSRTDQMEQLNRAARKTRPRFTASQREAVRRAAKGICRYCQKPVEKLIEESIDHIVPLSKGGKHLFSNWSFAHLRCNIVKGARLPTRSERWKP